MRRKMLVADLLCGAGGSTTGAIRAMLKLGFSMEDILLVCVNHWPTAIETHERNYPTARHYVQDIATVRPHIIVPEGYLDLLMASPTCTHHSVARGGKPTSDQQRSDPWHIITWMTELRVKRIIIENVYEFVSWGPVDHRTGKPIKSRKGEYFHAWIETIRRLGYDPEWRKLNAANYGGATTRQRFILKARHDRKVVRWAPLTHARHGAADLFSDMKPWRPAREIIDWSIKGKSIFARPIPLAPKTLARILAGAIKFGWPAVFVHLLHREIDRSLCVHLRRAFAKRHAKGKLRETRRALVRDYVDRLRHFRLAPHEFARGGRSTEAMLITLRRNGNGRSIGEPIPALAANGQHVALAEPVIMNGRKGNQALPVSTSPVPTLDTKGGVWLAEPLMLSQHSSGAPRSTRQPLPTITTGGAGAEQHVGCARPMLVEPFILNRHGDGYGETRAHSVDAPTPTSNCDGGGYLVEPFMLSRQGEGAPRSVADPTPTQVAKHSHVLISPYYSNGWQQDSGAAPPCYSADDPLPPVTTKGRFGMVVPVTQSGGGAQARDVNVDQVPTMTTAKGGEFALAEATPEYDILFRMLEPHELAAAMGFNTDEQKYEFAGTKTEMIKQIGNAVSVEMMEAEVGAIMADAAPASRIDYREAAE